MTDLVAAVFAYLRELVSTRFGVNTSRGGLMSVVLALAASVLASYMFGAFFVKDGGVRNEREEEERRALRELQRQRQQRQQQRVEAARTSSATTSLGGGTTTTTAGTATRNGADAIVGKLFNGARIVTVSANDVLFTRTPDGGFELKPAAVETIAALSRQIRGGLFIVSKVESDDEEEALRRLLSGAGVGVEQGQAPPTVVHDGDSEPARGTRASARLLVEDHKLLFCGTDIGKTAIVRQLEPQLHVESDRAVADELSRFIPRVVEPGGAFPF